MINRLTIIISLLSIVLFVNCSITKKLTQEDIDQYILVYEKLAEANDEIELKYNQSNSLLLITCMDCQPILDSVARAAGYANFESFLIMDIRIMYTMQYAAYLRVCEIIGESAKDVPQENLCEWAEKDESISEEDKISIKKYCSQMELFLKCVAKLSGALEGLSKYLLTIDDFEIVELNYDNISGAMMNPDLIGEFYRTPGGGWDD